MAPFRAQDTTFPLQNSAIFPSIPSPHTSYVVPVQVSETPMIHRNKQLRQHQRRSSLARRSNRLSSLLAHSLVHIAENVPAAEFYKHVSPDIPPPVRMKAMLLWSLKRTAIGQGEGTLPTLHSGTVKMEDMVKLIVQRVQQRVLTDILEHKLTTSWYDRPKSAEEINTALD